MKSKIMSFSLSLLIILGTIVMLHNATDTEDVQSDDELETALVKSMAETQKEKKKIEEFLTNASLELQNKGYEQVGLSYSPDDRQVSIQVPDEAFLEQNRSHVELIVLNVAKESKLQDFYVEYRVFEQYVELNEEQQELNESFSKESQKISEIISEKGFKNYSISFHPQNEIVIEATEPNLAKKDAMEKLIADNIYLKTNKHFTVKIKGKSEIQIRDQEWQPIFTAITDETRKEFDVYRGFAYSFHPEPLQIIIKTNLEKPKWFWNDDPAVKQITNYVDKIIELKREELSIEEIPYEMIIRDKNNKKLN